MQRREDLRRAKARTECAAAASRRGVLGGIAAAAAAMIADAASAGIRLNVRGRATSTGNSTVNLTVSLKSTGKTLLAAALATALSGVPTTNAVTLTQSLSSPVELTFGQLHTEIGESKITPSAAYNGTVGTGYNAWTEAGNARTATPDTAGAGGLGNETRVTAKPVVRLMTAWNRRFNGKIYIPIYASAKGGMNYIRGYAEGGYVDLTQQAWYRYTDQNGVEKWIWCYLLVLDSADWTGVGSDATRQVRMFIRAVANDGTMQTQLIGVGSNPSTQLNWFPCSAPHDYRALIDTTAGSDSINVDGGGNPLTYPSYAGTFTTYTAAERWLIGSTTVSGKTLSTAARAPLIEINRSGNLYPTTGGDNTTVKCWMTVTTINGATVNFGRASWDSTTADPIVGSLKFCDWRPNAYNIEWRGAGIVIDFNNLRDINYGNGLTIGMWGNGCTITNSGFNMQTHLDQNKQPRGTGGFMFMTDCKVDYGGLQGALVCVNNTLNSGFGDIFNGSTMVWGNQVNNWSSTNYERTYNAFTVSYSGAAAVATITIVGKAIVLTEDGTPTTLASLTTMADAAAVCTAINARAGWTATRDAAIVTGDGSRDRAPTGLVSANSPLYLDVGAGGNAKVTPQQATTYVTMHQDVRQGQGGANDNFAFCYNRIFGGAFLQTYSQDAIATDGIYEGNWYESIATHFDDASVVIAYNSKDLSHVRFLGNSDARITFSMGNGSGTWDAYCEFTGNVFNAFQWGSVTSSKANPTIKDCHFLNGSISDVNVGGQVSSGCTFGSAETIDSLYPNWATKKMAPAGSLLSNTITGPTSIDAGLADRRAATAKGGKGQALPDGSITVAQLGTELAAITANQNVGANIGSVQAAMRIGAANTGATLTVNIQFDAA